MPAYEFRCRQCGDTFVLQRPMSQSSDAAPCSAGHDDTVRLLNVASVGTTSTGGSSTQAAPSSGGCCGGGCCG
ncbi:MAG: zinc ribbon domain-containing protein [Actinomycetia bacterium]|nr:zinc ribbon domain-containing protein [Actinomycetes bacterium]MCH9707057.1 zinc ribbon domain-containing protein [Actinomycetes bacterium]MCH9850578.1 zinc ribbon domain-containing protein [Actinomycetes bacterium]